MHKSFAAMILGAMVALAQTQPVQTEPTAAELLQKGIYAEEVAGDLDGAIRIYHQIVDSHPIQREIAAQAQYRLGLSLIEKGDAASASQEIQRLGWDFPDYKELIASAKKASGGPTSPHIMFTVIEPTTQGRRQIDGLFVMDQRAAMERDLEKRAALDAVHDAEFDFTKTVTVSGTVTQLATVDSFNVLTVAPLGGVAPIRVSLDAVSWSRGNVKIGDQVTIVGAPARDGSSTIQAIAVTSAGHEVFARTVVTP
jgi:hypothetical protein